ncbi:MAG: M15 family metallopeptidase [Actinomycetota bacterium]|nr:M15 family metallopeptidase [Actinomycetota bacterium]
MLIPKEVRVGPGETAELKGQVLDGSSQPVSRALVFFQVAGSAFGNYEGVATFPVWTNEDGIAVLRYGYAAEDGPSPEIASQDVIYAWVLSGAALPDDLAARTTATELSWLGAMGEVSFGSLNAAVDPCDDPVQCDPLGLPYTDCISPTCEPPNICNVNCDIPPDPCVTVAACDIEVAELGPLQDPQTHEHRNYPRRPDGGSDITKVFGSPCNPKVNFNHGKWNASDGTTWAVNYHKKLGGDTASVFPDVRHHVNGQGLRKWIKAGVGAYNCRTVAGTTKYSTHAWGIAFDISSLREHLGHNNHNCHWITWERGIPPIWQDHNFYWGRNFSNNRDCMHFQYATGY